MSPLFPTPPMPLLVVLVAPIAQAVLHRIVIEEAALNSAPGGGHADHAGRTKRLIPFIC